jgi:putative transposase
MEEFVESRVATFESKGGNQGGNREKRWQPAETTNNGEGLRENEVWIGVVEGSNLIGVSRQLVKKNCKAGKYATKIVLGNGGKQYRILLSSLPEVAQRKYWAMRVSGGKDVLGLSGVSGGAQHGYTALEVEERGLWAGLCLMVEKTVSGGSLTATLKAVTEAVNSPASAEFEAHRRRLGLLTWQTLYVWYRKWQTCGRDAMHPDFCRAYKTRRGKSASERTSLTPEQQRVLEDFALSPNKPTVKTVLRLAREFFEKNGIVIPNERTARRHLERFSSENQLRWVSVRESMKKVNDSLVPWISRDPELIEIGDVLEIDGWQADFGVRSPITGKEVRCSITSAIDMRTTLRTGCDIALSETTMAYTSAIRQSCLLLGRLFGLGDDYAVMTRSIMMDNSKAAHSKFIEGLMERFKSKGFKGEHFAKKYHGQSKTIEQSLHRRYAEAAKTVTTYRGNNTMNKPSRLMRGEKMARVLYEDICCGYLPTLEEAHYALAEWLDRRQSEGSDGKYLKGKSPTAVAAESIERVKAQADFTTRILKREELEFMMMAWHEVSLRNGMVMFRGRLYQHDALSNFKQGKREFFVRYSIEDTSYVLVYRETGEFIGKATLWCGEQGLHPIAKYLGTEEQQEDVARANAVQQRIKKVAESLMRDQAAGEIDNHRRKVSQVKVERELKLLKKTGTTGEVYVEREENDYERMVREAAEARREKGEC